MSKRTVESIEASSEQLNEKRPRASSVPVSEDDSEEAPRSQPDIHEASQDDDSDSDEEYKEENEDDDIEYNPEECLDDEVANIQQDLLNRILLEDLQSADGNTVTQAANELKYHLVVVDDADFNDRFQEAGGHSIILVLIKKWNGPMNDPMTEFVQLTLQRCLAWLCMWRECLSRTLINLRAVDTALETTKKFTDSPRVQAACMEVVSRLCKAPDGSANQVCDSVERFDGVSLVYNTMKAAPNNRLVQLWGCHCLRSFCELKIEKLIETNGEAITLTGIFVQNFPGDAMAAFSFLNTLRSICGYGSETDEESEDEENDKEAGDD